jgi:RNA polymerase sigma-70 factor (ECF subfamily)
MTQTEDEIIRRAKQGHEDALKKIIEIYEHKVAATVIGILGNGPEVDDIGQETFVQFFRSLPRFRGESQVGTYITRIAINLSLNELKRRKRHAKLLDENLAENVRISRNRSDQESAADIKNMIRQGLQQLQPEFKAVIVLRLINGYSTRETAEILSLAQGTVLSRLARGQAKLRQIIADMIKHKS